MSSMMATTRSKRPDVEEQLENEIINKAKRISDKRSYLKNRKKD